MSGTVSASPEDLQPYASSQAAERQNLAASANALTSRASGVAAASESWVVESTNLRTATDLCGVFEKNEDFVGTIREELLTADEFTGGVATVPASRVQSALKRDGVSEAPTALEVSESALAGMPPSSGFVDDPINAAIGNFIHFDHDVRFPALSGALDLTRSYNSMRSTRTGVFGAGWWSVLDVGLRFVGSAIEVDLADGATETLVGDDVPIPEVDSEDTTNSWRGMVRRSCRLHRVEDGFELATDQVRRWYFDSDGLLTGWRSGVATVQVERSSGRIVIVRNVTTGRELLITWAGDLVASVTTDVGREIHYRYDSSSAHGHLLLTRVTSPSGSIDYEYDLGGRLSRATDPDGISQFDNTYDESGRVQSQVSPFGRVTTYRYEPSGTTIIRDQVGTEQAMVHDRRGNLTAIIDHDGSTMRLSYDRQGRVTKVVERDGATWTYDFDEDDRPTKRVDPDGAFHRWVYDERGRLTETTDRAGLTTRREYDTDFEAASRVIGPGGAVSSQQLNALGLPTAITDPDGVTTELEWDTDGQLVKIVGANGSSTEFRYNANGWLREMARPLGAPTLLDCDAAGRVTRSERGETVAEYAYSHGGRVIGGVDPGGVRWSATYGRHGMVETVSDTVNGEIGFTYDDQGNVVGVTAADGAVYSNAFDAIGRHVASSDPSGATSRKGYDNRGRLTAFTDPNGNTWTRTIDALDRTTESVDPAGGITRYTYHQNGQVETITSPDGRRWRHEYDSAGRQTAVIAPDGRRAERWYTAAGRIAGRRSPAGRTETFGYDQDGLLETITGIDGMTRYLKRDRAGRLIGLETEDQRVRFDHDEVDRLIGVGVDGEWWRFDYDTAGRTTGTTDPTGVENTFEYDSRGLLANATDGAGGLSQYSYDQRGRLAQQRTPDDRDMSFAYDAAGRLASWTDPAGATTDFRFDPAGNLVSERSADGTGWERRFDELGRETERRSLDGTIDERFRYDPAGRLAEAFSNVGTTIGFMWDDADRLVGEATPNGDTALIRDADGWLTEIVRPDGDRIVIDRDDRGSIVSVGGDPIEIPDLERDVAGRVLLGSDGTAYRYDDAGRLAEVAPPGSAPTLFHYRVDGLIDYEEGPSGTRRFSYDVAGRVVQIDIDRLGTTRIAYDDAGRRVNEYRWNGSITRYLWDGLGRLSAIVTSHRDGSEISHSVVYDALGRPSIVDGDPVGFSALGRPAEGIRVGQVTLLGARALDVATHQFLSSDPLLAKPGSNGAASAYTYAWNDPVNFVDPDGLRPISTEEYNAIRKRAEQGRLGQAWEAVSNDPWGTLAMVGVVAVGVGLCFVPGGQAIGAGILIGAASQTVAGLATGNFDPRRVAISGAFGAIPGASTVGGAIAAAGASSIGEDVAQSLIAGDGFPPPGQLVTNAAISMGTAGVLSGGVRLAGEVRPTAANSFDELNPPHSSAALSHTATPPPTPAVGQKVYRVYGGDSLAGGASWSPINPATVDNYRDLAGLPSGGASGATNTGQFVIEGILTDPTQVVDTRRALPLDGMKGGLPEYIIPNWRDNGAIEVIRVSGANPEF